jgi:GNAT superfamily N-acetyltransferase
MHRIRLAVCENRLTDPSSVQAGHYEEMLGARGRGWVAEVRGQIAGFAIADLTDATVWALFVDAEFEGQGVGRALHHAMIGWLFAQGLDSVSLRTTPGTRAERFYLAAGWRYLRPASDGEACYLLRREGWKAG